MQRERKEGEVGQLMILGSMATGPRYDPVAG